jgi:hypothetical protein
VTPFLLNDSKLRCLSPRANYTDRATAACRRSWCQLLRLEGATWSAWRNPRPYYRVSRPVLLNDSKDNWVTNVAANLNIFGTFDCHSSAAPRTEWPLTEWP